MMALAFTSCNHNDNANGSVNDNINDGKGALRIAVVPVEECLPLLVAEHLGLLDSLHGNARVTRYGALSECREAMARHKADAMVNDSAIGYRMLTSQKSRIHRVAQLSDKVIAADKEGCSYDMARAAIDSLLRQKRHVFIIQVEDMEVRTKMLTTGNIDAALLPEPHATQAVKQGAYEISLTGKMADRGRLAHSLLTKTTPAIERSLKTARDSIKRYGKENYYYLLEGVKTE